MEIAQQQLMPNEKIHLVGEEMLIHIQRKHFETGQWSLRLILSPSRCPNSLAWSVASGAQVDID